MSRIHWLLEVTIDGRLYRWATQRVTVTTADGDALEYEGGLGDLSLAIGDQPSVVIVDTTMDWPTLGRELLGSSATVLRWTEGDDYEEAVVYSRGLVVGVEYGDQHDPASFAIEERGGLGVQMPDPLARVDDATWPITASHETGSHGAFYPIILGYPGYRGFIGSTDPTSYPIVSVPVAEWSDVTSPATASIIVAEDIDASITTVTLRSEALQLDQNEAVVTGTDNLGRALRRITIADNEAIYPDARGARFYAGYYPAGGGGVARSAYDVVVYLLRRWGSDSVDWGRLADVEDVLTPFLVDTWIDAPMTDPWAWLESAIFGDLPVEVRTSRAGRYLVHRRYASDRSRRVGSVSADRGDVQRVSRVRHDDVGPTNEFTGHYRASREGDWMGKLILTGDTRQISANARVTRALTTSTTTESIAVLPSGLCLASVARFGVRQSEGIEIDWTWDEGTMLRVLELRAQREALPARLIDYQFEDGEDLEEGDELLLTDSGLGLTDAPAIIDAPPVRDLHTTSVTLRLPESV